MSKVYYVSERGSNLNDGLTPDTPFADFTNITEFDIGGGNRILLERGSTIFDRLNLNAITNKSGTIVNPNILSSYGNPRASKPIISGAKKILLARAGSVFFAVTNLAEDPKYITINGTPILKDAINTTGPDDGKWAYFPASDLLFVSLSAMKETDLVEIASVDSAFTTNGAQTNNWEVSDIQVEMSIVNNISISGPTELARCTNWKFDNVSSRYAGSNGFQLQDVDDIYVDSCNADDCTNNNFNVKGDYDNIHITNCTAINIYGDLSREDGCCANDLFTYHGAGTNGSFVNCSGEGTYEDGVDITGGNDNFLVENCSFSRTGQTPIIVTGTNCLILGCHQLRSGRGFRIGGDSNTLAFCTALHGAISDNGTDRNPSNASGLHISGTNARVYNNTFIADSNSIRQAVLIGVDSAGGVFANNIIQVEAGGNTDMINFIAGVDVASWDFKSNTYFHADGTDDYIIEGVDLTFADWISAVSDTNASNLEPEWVVPYVPTTVEEAVLSNDSILKHVSRAWWSNGPRPLMTSSVGVPDIALHIGANN